MITRNNATACLWFDRLVYAVSLKKKETVDSNWLTIKRQIDWLVEIYHMWLENITRLIQIYARQTTWFWDCSIFYGMFTTNMVTSCVSTDTLTMYLWCYRSDNYPILQLLNSMETVVLIKVSVEGCSRTATPKENARADLGMCPPTTASNAKREPNFSSRSRYWMSTATPMILFQQVRFSKQLQWIK